MSYELEREQLVKDFDINLLKITKKIRAANEGQKVKDIPMTQIASFEDGKTSVEVHVSYCGGYFFFYSYSYYGNVTEPDETYYKFCGTWDSPIEELHGEEMYSRPFDWGSEVDGSSIVSYKTSNEVQA